MSLSSISKLASLFSIGLRLLKVSCDLFSDDTASIDTDLLAGMVSLSLPPVCLPWLVVSWFTFRPL